MMSLILNYIELAVEVKKNDWSIGSNEQVKPWLFQTLITSIRPDSNSRFIMQIRSFLSLYYTPYELLLLFTLAIDSIKNSLIFIFMNSTTKLNFSAPSTPKKNKTIITRIIHICFSKRRLLFIVSNITKC